MKMTKIIAVGAFLSLGFSIQAYGAEVCEGYGPQTPRDISSKAGSNAGTLTRAPSSEDMNLCNIHFHTQAEHKGPGFSVSAGGGEFGGFKCNETPSLTKAELEDPTQGHGACHGVKPGDTVEMHWVYTSCDVMPGEGLGSCLSDKCLNPQLRVETQVFLVVNDPNAADFASFTYDGNIVNALHQSKACQQERASRSFFRALQQALNLPRKNVLPCRPHGAFVLHVRKSMSRPSTNGVRGTFSMRIVLAAFANS